MECIKCNAELKQGAKFCSKCGQKVEANVVNITENKSILTNETNIARNSTTTNCSNSFAIAGFVISIVSSIFLCGSFNWLSLVFSIVGLVKSKELNGEGKGLAIAGIIISAILLVIYILWMIVFGGIALIEGFSN